MKQLSCTIVALLAGIPLALQNASPAGAAIAPVGSYVQQVQSSSQMSGSSPCARFNTVNSLIRDGKICKRPARNEVKRLLAEVSKQYYRTVGTMQPKTAWVFPLAGYDARVIDKGRRHGFSPRGYDFFSGNRHGGHPAYDIFIRDRDQRSRDDRTGLPVQVLSVTGGIVVALERNWEEGSGLRGGKYVWVYDPVNELLVYYAHNDELFVGLGEVVKPGQLLATVGRSGLNAAKRRSPTHLHLSVLKVRDGQPVPLNVYRQLARSRTVLAAQLVESVVTGTTAFNADSDRK